MKTRTVLLTTFLVLALAGQAFGQPVEMLISKQDRAFEMAAGMEPTPVLTISGVSGDFGSFRCEDNTGPGTTLCTRDGLDLAAAASEPGCRRAQALLANQLICRCFGGPSILISTVEAACDTTEPLTVRDLTEGNWAKPVGERLGEEWVDAFVANFRPGDVDRSGSEIDESGKEIFLGPSEIGRLAKDVSPQVWGLGPPNWSAKVVGQKLSALAVNHLRVHAVDLRDGATGRGPRATEALLREVEAISKRPGPSPDSYWNPDLAPPPIHCPDLESCREPEGELLPPLPPGMDADVLVAIDGSFHVVTADVPQKMMRFPLGRTVSALEFTFSIDIKGCSPDSPNGKPSVCNLAWLCADGMGGCWLETFAYLNEGGDMTRLRGTSKWGNPNAGKKNTRATTQINDTSRHPVLDAGLYDVLIRFDGRSTLSEISNDSGFFRSVEAKTPFGKPVNLDSFTGVFGFHGRDKGAESVWVTGTTFLNLKVREVTP